MSKDTRLNQKQVLTQREAEEVYRAHIGLMRRRATQILRSESLGEDLAQESFMRWVHYRNKGERETDTAAFLYRTTTNLAINHLRDRKNRARLLKEKVAPTKAPSPDGMSEEQARTGSLALEKALEVAGEEEARIAVYYYVDGMEQEEIAQLLGMQRRTVGRRLERFREEAKKVLAS